MSLLGAQKISVEQNVVEKGCILADAVIDSLADLVVQVQEINDILSIDFVGEMSVNFKQAAELLELQLQCAQKYLSSTNEEVRWNVATTKALEQEAISKIGGRVDE